MKIEYSQSFLRQAKQLAKKFKLLKQDLQQAVQDIQTNQNLGVELGNNLFKKRVKNSSIPTGKSGGFRIIIYAELKNSIVLIAIYSKTEKDTLTDAELSKLIESYISF